MKKNTTPLGVRQFISQFVQVNMIERKDIAMEKARVKELTYAVQGGAHALLFYLQRIYLANEALPSIATIADELGKKPQHISILVEQLWEVDLLWKIKKPGKAAKYYFNPNHFWIGTDVARKNHIREIAQFRVVPTATSDSDLPQANQVLTYK